MLRPMDGDNEPRFGGISGRRWLFRDICIGGHRGREEIRLLTRALPMNFRGISHSPVTDSQSGSAAKLRYVLLYY